MEKTMTGSIGGFQGRRVVTGIGPDGKSRIVEDADAVSRSDLTGELKRTHILDIWQMDSLPPNDTTDSTLVAGDVETYSPMGGVIWRLGIFPPDSEWDKAVEAAGANAPTDPYMGMHTTETVDILTVISGEVHLVLEDGETLLRPGDSAVQRGTVHTWSNRTDQPCITVVAMIPLVRTEG
jgi:mannose-6-phosphate isomerase-like protein (cupin superfamily)